MNRIHITALIILVASTWGITLSLHGVSLSTSRPSPSP